MEVESQASNCFEEWNSACLWSSSPGDRPLVELYLEPAPFPGQCNKGVIPLGVVTSSSGLHSKRSVSNLRGNLGFLLRCCSGKRPHLARTVEPHGFSQDTAGFSSYDEDLREPLDLAQGSPISIRVISGSRGLLSSHCRANRPHLGMYPQIPCSFPVATGISVLHSRFTRGVRPRSSGNKVFWSPLQ